MAKKYEARGNNSGFTDVALSHIPELEKFVIPNVTFTGNKLGEGSYGSVEEVAIPKEVCAEKHIRWSSVFAAKQLHHRKEDYDLLRDPLVKECHLMDKARHPNLVTFFGISYPSGERQLPALVMERLEISFHDKLEQPEERMTFSFEQRLSILVDVSKGLVYLHSRSPPLIHRDLTAKNVLLTSNGVGKISDFGMAKIIELPSLSKSISHTKNPGNTFYMPPETSADSHAMYSTPIDVFSFGVVALFAGTQKFPKPLPSTYFDHKKGSVAARNEIERREKSFIQLSKAIGTKHRLNALVKQCLEFRPKSRPTAEQLQRSLESMIRTKSVSHDHTEKGALKVILLGQSGVGKTALLNQYVDGIFNPYSTATVGEMFSTKHLKIDGYNVTVHIWDTAGQEKFQAIAPMVCRNSDACLLVFDVNKPTSLDAIAETWLPKIKDHSPEAVCMLVGNCSDQRDDTETSTVQPQQARDFAERNEMSFIETSAKTSSNVTEAFEQVIQEAYRKAKLRAHLVPDPDTKTLTVTETPVNSDSSSSGCC